MLDKWYSEELFQPGVNGPKKLIEILESRDVHLKDVAQKIKAGDTGYNHSFILYYYTLQFTQNFLSSKNIFKNIKNVFATLGSILDTQSEAESCISEPEWAKNCIWTAQPPSLPPFGKLDLKCEVTPHYIWLDIHKLNVRCPHPSINI